MDLDELVNLVATVADEDPLLGLRAITQARGEMEGVEAVLVRRARNAGVTWSDIAAVLGVSKQAVHKKHGGRRLVGGQP